MKLKNRHLNIFIARLIACALLLEFALYPHLGVAAGVGATLLQPTIFAHDLSVSLRAVPFVQYGTLLNDARAVQALPATDDLRSKRRHVVVITAYSSTPDQTDDTPFITANGTRVRDGIIAANFLRFGTQVTIPSLYGDKVFYVTDRMHERFSDRVDIWMHSRKDAQEFGVKVATIEVY